MATENGPTLSPTPPKPLVRDIRLDAFRGLLLTIMTVDHLPTILKNITFEWAGYVSAAQGFVFLSGFVNGMTYTRLSLQGDGSEACRRASLRACTIYLFHMGAFIALFFALRAIHSSDTWSEPWQPLFQQNALKSLLMGATFLSQPPCMAILPLYCILVPVAPHIVTQFKKGNTFLVISTSLALWIAAQFDVRTFFLSLLSASLPVNLGEFDIFAWQTIFIAGLYCGFKHYTDDGNHFTIPIWGTMYAGGVVLMLFLCRHDFVFGHLGDAIRSLADTRTLGIVRVLDVSALCILVMSFRWSENGCFLLKPLAYLGRNSLQVFTFHIFIVYAINILCGDTAVQGWSTGGLLVAACLTSLFVPAWLAERIRGLKRIFLLT